MVLTAEIHTICNFFIFTDSMALICLGYKCIMKFDSECLIQNETGCRKGIFELTFYPSVMLHLRLNNVVP